MAVVHPAPRELRGDDVLGPHEDVEREPDGIPHDVIGLTAFFSVMLAMLLGTIFVTGGTGGGIAAVLIGVFAIPALVSSLSRRADRERDPEHPAR
jgi:hypothetical protein